MRADQRLGSGRLSVRPAKFTAYAVIYCGVVTFFQGVLAFVFANALQLNSAGVGALCVVAVGVFISGFGVEQLRSTPAVKHQYGRYEYVIGGLSVVATVLLLVSVAVV